MEIISKPGYILNPNPKIVQSITKRIEKNNGICACHNDSIDPHCPCTNFREKGECHCKLYIKDGVSK